MFTRLSTQDATAAVMGVAPKVLSWLERSMLAGPLEKIVSQLYGTSGPAHGRYAMDEATEIFIAQAVRNGYPDEQIRNKVRAIVAHLYNGGYFAGLDAAGFYLGKD